MERDMQSKAGERGEGRKASLPFVPNATVKVERICRHNGAESSCVSYRCEHGGIINVEVEHESRAVLFEQPEDRRCSERCWLHTGWEGGVTVRQVAPCWREGLPAEPTDAPSTSQAG